MTTKRTNVKGGRTKRFEFVLSEVEAKLLEDSRQVVEAQWRRLPGNAAYNLSMGAFLRSAGIEAQNVTVRAEALGAALGAARGVSMLLAEALGFEYAKAHGGNKTHLQLWAAMGEVVRQVLDSQAEAQGGEVSPLIRAEFERLLNVIERNTTAAPAAAAAEAH